MLRAIRITPPSCIWAEIPRANVFLEVLSVTVLYPAPNTAHTPLRKVQPKRQLSFCSFLVSKTWPSPGEKPEVLCTAYKPLGMPLSAQLGSPPALRPGGTQGHLPPCISSSVSGALPPGVPSPTLGCSPAHPLWAQFECYFFQEACGVLPNWKQSLPPGQLLPHDHIPWSEVIDLFCFCLIIACRSSRGVLIYVHILPSTRPWAWPMGDLTFAGGSAPHWHPALNPGSVY